MPTLNSASKSTASPDDDVVISGIAGVFPESDNVLELAENLFAKRDLVTEDDRRWKRDHPEIPQPTGKLKTLNKFDAAFFGVHAKQANSMDPMSRILLEKTFEAVVDAGYNPKQLKGTKTGVFVGVCFSDAEKSILYEAKGIDGCSVVGCSRSMFANRISFWLDIHGPSYALDTACSSSMYALEHGYRAIKEGLCDAALVCGCNLCLHPYVSLSYARLGVCNLNGKCRSFDEAGSGYVRSEAVVVVLLQKRKHSRRIYARLVHAKTNCDGFTEQGITCPSFDQQRQLLEDFYRECDVDPNNVDYIEAHGTGTPVGDPIEVRAIEKVLCQNRKRTLKIGSIKSNIGHTEPVSALCGITKIILAFELGQIPPNIHLQSPRANIEAFHNGNMKVTDEPTQIDGPLAALNSFGFGGANGHALLESHSKEKINNGIPTDSLPRLVVVSGRTEEAVNVTLNDLERRPLDVEYVRLLHEIYSENIPGHLHRGYILLDEQKKLERHNENFSGEKRPVWFVFTGMGSQWYTMGRWLLQIPVSATAIRECHEILKKENVDLIDIITTDDPSALDNISNAFVGITAIQVALIDLLETLGIRPDGIIGHSLGELACAYVDGCFTKQQTILAAYYRGRASIEVDFIPGMMASVGLGHEVAKKIIPAEIDIACHNSPTNCTISGPAETTRDFSIKLQNHKIFVREVNVSNIAYHSRYVAKAGPKILDYMKKLIPKPTRRREHWICTSQPESKWSETETLYSCAEYYTNNLLNPVYFEEGCRHIPQNAIVIEIAPHGLLQAILRRSLVPTITKLSLTDRRSDNHINFFLTALGKFFEAGGDIKLHKLYPAVEFPVSKGTPMISPLIRWQHNEYWYVPSYHEINKNQSGGRNFSISLANDDQKYLAGHCIDGRILYPATGYIVLVWETLSSTMGRNYRDLPVVFDDVRFEKPLHVPNEDEIILNVSIQRGSGYFEITHKNTVLVTGKVHTPENIDKEFVNKSNVPLKNGFANHKDIPCVSLNSEDVYKELRIRGYNYRNEFKSIVHVENEENHGKIAWNDNYVTFLDNMLQLKILKDDTRKLKVPISIERIVIDAKQHLTSIKNQTSQAGVEVYLYPESELIQTPGIEIQEIKTASIVRKAEKGKLVLQKYQFMPYHCLHKTTTKEILNAFVQITVENLNESVVKVAELVEAKGDSEDCILAPELVTIFEDIPAIQVDITVHNKSTGSLILEETKGITESKEHLSNCKDYSMIIASNILNNENTLVDCYKSLKPNGFLFVREKLTANVKIQSSSIGFNICSSFNHDERRFLLLRKRFQIAHYKESVSCVEILNNSFSWITNAKETLKGLNPERNQKLVLYADKEIPSGILGFFNCLKKEFPVNNMRCFYILDKTAPKFSIDHPFYKTQLAKELALNVYKNGQWGSYRHLPLDFNDTVQTPHAYVTTQSRGDLTSLKWIEGPINPAKRHGDKIVHVYYSPLNFRDVMMATGGLASETLAQSRLQGECTQGFEYAGKLANGLRVMGIVPGKAIASLIEGDEDLMWKVPDDWTLEEAATVPVVYATVLRALITCGRMKRGESILIHAGSGGVGQAAINVCLHYGCTIFTTVGSDLKKKFIRQNFSTIPEDHIGNSRDTSFQSLIMEKTKGRGVDLVLNSLADDKLQASIRCLNKLGRFLEIGRVDIAKNSSIGMKHFEKEITFCSVLVDKFFYAEKERKLELKTLVDEALAAGLIKPLVRKIFEADQVESAFRFMASGKHTGKILIKIRDEESPAFLPPEVVLKNAVPKFSCSPNKTYIICGGLGGFGLELADWLILRGARIVILTSRKGIVSGYQDWRVRLWKSYGVQVVVLINNTSTEEDTKHLLRLANKYGPVAGIFNLAVVLEDSAFENQNEESFAAAWKPKAESTMFLDKVSRQVCPHLENFVVFSSVVSGYGNAGQTNYGMANSAIERVCEARKADKLPAVAIQWGAIADVGIVAEMAKDSDIKIVGTLPQSLSSCLESLDISLKQSNAVVLCIVVAEKQASEKNATTLIDIVANILGIKNLKTISMHSTLAELGTDSMMNIEIKQILDRELKVSLSTQEIRRLTFAQLEDKVLEHGRLSSAFVNGTEPQHCVTNGETHSKNEPFSQQSLEMKLATEKSAAQNSPIHKEPTVLRPLNLENGVH